MGEGEGADLPCRVEVAVCVRGKSGGAFCGVRGRCSSGGAWGRWCERWWGELVRAGREERRGEKSSEVLGLLILLISSYCLVPKLELPSDGVGKIVEERPISCAEVIRRIARFVVNDAIGSADE